MIPSSSTGSMSSILKHKTVNWHSSLSYILEWSWQRTGRNGWICTRTSSRNKESHCILFLAPLMLGCVLYPWALQGLRLDSWRSIMSRGPMTIWSICQQDISIPMSCMESIWVLISRFLKDAFNKYRKYHKYWNEQVWGIVAFVWNT